MSTTQEHHHVTVSYRKRFGKNLARLRQSRLLSQRELGQLVHTEGGHPNPIPRHHISRYEAGERYPRLETRVALARVLRVPVASLDDEVGGDE